MGSRMHGASFFVATGAAIMLALSLAGAASADDLTKQIQVDLAALGYDLGAADGEMGIKTQLAIGKFQQAHNLPVDGKPSFDLAIAISSELDAVRNGSAPSLDGTTVADTVTAAATEPVDAPSAVPTRQSCLEEAAAQAKAKQKKKRFLSTLAQVGTQVAARFGGVGAVMTAYDAANVASMATELGIPEADASACMQLPE